MTILCCYYCYCEYKYTSILHTSILQSSGVYLGLPGWAGTTNVKLLLLHLLILQLFIALWILSGTTQVSRLLKRLNQKGKTNLDFTEARDSEWHWHHLGHIQICPLPQIDNHTSTAHHSVFLQSRCPSYRPANSIKALKAVWIQIRLLLSYLTKQSICW